MNPSWRSFLESADAVFDGASDELLHFGDAAGELRAATQQTVLVPLTHLALIEAAGEDAKSFLHSQFTSDVNHLSAGQLQHSAWCSAKGRMQASFLLWPANDGYRMLLAADLEEAIHKRLQMFVLRAKVKLARAGDALLALGVAGPQAAEALAEAGLPHPETALSVAEHDGCTVLRIEAERYIVVFPAAAMATLWQKLGVKARAAGLPAWRWLDVANAFPLVTLATKEEFVPQMADFEKIGGVSFHKGCYPGQEVVARTQYLGKVKRHLFRIRSTVAPLPGQVIHSPDNPDQSVGSVMSVAPAPEGGYVGLAVIQSNFAGNVRLGALDGAALETVAVNP